MTEEKPFKWDDLTPDERERGRKAGAPTLLASRIAIQNLIHPIGQRYQEEFQLCLDEVKNFVPELDGLSFFHLGDLQVEIKNDYSKVVVSFEARKVTQEEAEKYQKLRERTFAWETQKPIKADATVAVVTN